MAYPSPGSTSTPQWHLSGKLALVFVFVIVGGLFILLSKWKEPAQFVQGFLISLFIILLLSYSNHLHNTIDAALNEISAIAKPIPSG